LSVGIAAPGGLVIGGWWIQSELDVKKCELVVLEVVDQNSAPAPGGPDHPVKGHA